MSSTPSVTRVNNTNNFETQDVAKYVCVALACVSFGIALSSLVSGEVLFNNDLPYKDEIVYWPEFGPDVLAAESAMREAMTIAAIASSVAAFVFGGSAFLLDRKSPAKEETETQTGRRHLITLGLAVAAVGVGLLIGMGIAQIAINKVDLRALVWDKAPFPEYPQYKEIFDWIYGKPLQEAQMKLSNIVSTQLLIPAVATMFTGSALAGYFYCEKVREQARDREMTTLHTGESL